MSLMIKTEKLTKDFGGGRGVKSLDMEVTTGSIFGYVGPNGSGKTTTIRCLCGLLEPDQGRAWINDLEVLPRNHTRIKSIIGFLPDEFGVYQQMSVWEYLDFFGAAYKIPPKERRKRIDYVLDVTDAKHMLDYQVSSLSRGMHQKIGIAKTLIHDPTLLILDEPANGLDPYARVEMRNTILRLKDIGKTILLSSHILPELAAICDEVGIIEKGSLIIQGTVREISRRLQQNILLEIEVDSNIDEAAEVVRDFPNVSKVVVAGQEIRADFQGKRQDVAQLNRLLIEKGVRVIAVKESEADLENVFLAVTRGGQGVGDSPSRRLQQPTEAKPADVDTEARREAHAARVAVESAASTATKESSRRPQVRMITPPTEAAAASSDTSSNTPTRANNAAQDGKADETGSETKTGAWRRKRNRPDAPTEKVKPTPVVPKDRQELADARREMSNRTGGKVTTAPGRPEWRQEIKRLVRAIGGSEEGNRLLEHKLKDGRQVDLYFSAPTPARAYFTLFTIGLSELINDGDRQVTRYELFTYLPSDWPLDFTAEPDAYWPARMIAELAAAATEKPGDFGPGFFLANSEPPKPWIASSKLCGAIATEPAAEDAAKTVSTIGGETVEFLEIVPLTCAEMKLGREKGKDELLRILREKKLPGQPIQPDRDSVIEG